MTRSGKQRYLNVIQVEDGNTADFIFLRYVLSEPDKLRSATMMKRH